MGGATWCISESGACGPTFTFPDITVGFVAIFVSGPVERGVFAESKHNNRELNMWSYTKLALDLLAECVAEAALTSVPNVLACVPALIDAKEDRYGGIEATVRDEVAAMMPCSVRFGAELHRNLEAWQVAGKRGIWLRIPEVAGSLIGAACRAGFQFHHAKPGYAQLTRWLPKDEPNPLPLYGFTQIGVGGVVVNSKDEVLMVKERVSPMPHFQGSWKLPGGLADPAEDFADAVCREVSEETGVEGSLLGVVSMRHSHGFRFGQGDLYVLVKMRADKDHEEIKVDPTELLDAQWMSQSRIESLVAEQDGPLDGKVSANNWKMINNALVGSLIIGTAMPASRGPKPSMLYTVPPQPKCAI